MRLNRDIPIRYSARMLKEKCIELQRELVRQKQITSEERSMRLRVESRLRRAEEQAFEDHQELREERRRRSAAEHHIRMLRDNLFQAKDGIELLKQDVDRAHMQSQKNVIQVKRESEEYVAQIKMQAAADINQVVAGAEEDAKRIQEQLKQKMAEEAERNREDLRNRLEQAVEKANEICSKYHRNSCMLSLAVKAHTRALFGEYPFVLDMYASLLQKPEPVETMSLQLMEAAAGPADDLAHRSAGPASQLDRQQALEDSEGAARSCGSRNRSHGRLQPARTAAQENPVVALWRGLCSPVQKFWDETCQNIARMCQGHNRPRRRFHGVPQVVLVRRVEGVGR